ncbi:hypothetical protein BMETH_3330162250644, partial [methanotrophic bacterial endosymbiont of Bathymodiolus sp.]
GSFNVAAFCEVEADAGRTGAYPIRSVCE